MIPREEFGKIFAYLTAAYPRQKYTDLTISVYYDTLSFLDPAALKLACKAWVSKEKWFPSASELRRAAYTSGQLETSADRHWKYAGWIKLMNEALAYRRVKLAAGGENKRLEEANDERLH